MTSVSYTGYGVAGFEIYKSLMSKGVDVHLGMYGSAGRDSQEDIKLLSKGVNRYFHHDAPCVNIWHQYDLARSMGRGKYIAFPFFELDTFNEQELHHLSYPDELAVASKWAKEVVEKNNIKTPTYVVPLGVDTKTFRPPLREIPNKNYVFLNIGKWEVRKGHNILVHAFDMAFNATDNVELWLMPTNHFITKEQNQTWVDLYMKSPMGRAGKIKILPWVKNQHDVVRVMQDANCGVFPSRAEGWNLELLEMMACGKPVITTNYSAHTEFCDSTNSMLIDITETEKAFDGKWFFGQGSWAKLGDSQIEQLVFCMKTMRSLGPRINYQGIETAHQFSWDNTTNKLLERL